MICVKVELWPASRGGEKAAVELGRMYIANVGGTHTHGNYSVAVCRKGSTAIPEGFAGCTKATRLARVGNYPRLAYNVWRLILRALVNAFPEDKKLQSQEFFGSVVTTDEDSLADEPTNHDYDRDHERD